MIPSHSEFKHVFNQLPSQTRFTWIATSIFGLFNAIVEIAISILVGVLLAASINGNFGNEKIPIVGFIELKSLVWALLFAIFCKFLFNVLEINTKARATTKSISYYSSKILESLLDSDSNNKVQASQLHVTIIDDTNNTFRWFFFGLVSLVSNIFTFIALFLIALISELRMTLLFGIILIVMVVPVTWWVNFSQIKLNLELQSVSNSIYNLIKQTVEIKTEIQLYKKHDDFKEMFTYKRHKKANLESQSLKKANYPRIAIELSFLLSIFGFALVSSLSNGMNYESQTFYIFVFCVLRIVPIFGRITNDITSIKAGTPALLSIGSIDIDEKTSGQGKLQNIFTEDFKIEITLKDISYNFGESTVPQLENVCLTINHGDKIAIVGGSGQGKTTLLEIILGLRQPTNGQILVDGRVLDSYDSWKPYVGYVSQRYDVYDYSLRQAITFDFFSEDIDDDKFSEISEALDFEEATIERLHKSSEASKFNQNLSGGQLQRVAIARALYSRSNLIVLDEATSNLDSKTSKKIVEYLLKSDRTVLLVTHKVSEITGFNKIVYVRNGTVKVEMP